MVFQTVQLGVCCYNGFSDRSVRGVLLQWSDRSVRGVLLQCLV